MSHRPRVQRRAEAHASAERLARHERVQRHTADLAGSTETTFTGTAFSTTRVV